MVSIITCTIRDDHMDEVFFNYENQLLKDKELIIILNRDTINLNKWKEKAKKHHNVKVYQLREQASLGECLNFGVQQSTYPYVAKFDDDDYYSPHYLNEAMEAFQETDASVVGKTSIFMYFKSNKLLTEYMPGNEHKYTHFEKGLNSKLVMGGTLVFKKEVHRIVKFPERKVGTDSDFILDCIKYGLKIYSTSKFNYVGIRQKNEKKHTWQVKNDKLLRFSKVVMETEDYTAYVSRCNKA